MKTVYKILRYDGLMHTLRYWMQKLLEYAFIYVDRLNTMMQDVDALSRYLESLVVQRAKFTRLFCTKDINDRADAYISSVFDELLSSNKYVVKNNSSNIRYGIVTCATSLAKRKQANLCAFNSIQSSESNTRRKFVNTELSPCLNTVVNTSVMSSF